MLPGMGVDPKQMMKLMQQMGVKASEMPADKVIVEKRDGGRMVVQSPSVTLIEFQGQSTLQVSGKFSEESGEGGDPDLKLVMSETGASEERARKALEESGGDIAKAIMDLQNESK